MADNRAETVPFRGGGFKHKPAVAVSMMVFVVLILFWELGARTGFISNLDLGRMDTSQTQIEQRLQNESENLWPFTPENE